MSWFTTSTANSTSVPVARSPTSPTPCRGRIPTSRSRPPAIPISSTSRHPDSRRERDLEQALTDHVEKFLLELGQGFAFVGRQVHLEIGDADFYADLLFYHLRLRCFVVIELKVGDFDPSYLGQLGMYMSAVDDLLRHPEDKPTIGLVLCKTKNNVVAEYALRGYTAPIGVAEWKTAITASLPPELETSLPTVEELEAELDGGSDEERS